MSFDCFNAIYIVRPLPQLVELIQQIDADWGFLITEPQVLSRLEGAHQGSWTTGYSLRDAEVKTIFLLWLRKEYFREGTSEFGHFLAKLVQFPRIDVMTFNSWWYLERFDCIHDTCENLLNTIGRPSATEIRHHPEIVGYDEWIQTLSNPQ